MKRTMILLLLALVGLPAGASNRIAAQEGLPCMTCHDKPGSRLLTDRGKYYEAVGTLDGYDEVVAAFSECTGCHVSKPGSLKLTETGKAFAVAVNDMVGLRQWVKENHPKPQASH